MRKITNNQLRKVKKPVRYIGSEYNECIKDKNNKVRVCSAYSNLYEIGVLKPKFNSIYYHLNERNDCYLERTFLPDNDLLQMMEKDNFGLQTLETKDFVNEFDIIIFNVNDVLEYINVLKMLKLSNVEIYSKSRTKKGPVVIAMGDAIEKNFSPIADFIDFFIIGQPEGVLDLVLDRYKEYRLQNLTKIDYLRMLKNIQGIYIPSIHSNTLVYSAVNSNIDCENSKVIIPNMAECFEVQKLNRKTMEVLTNSNRLRKKLKLKEIDNNEYLVSFFTEAIKEKVREVKINFVLGLPGENYQDIKSTCKFMKKIIRIYKDILPVADFIFKLTFEFENFVIYPHTKFEWFGKNNSEDIINKKEFIEENVSIENENIKFSFDDPYVFQFKQFLLFSDNKVSDKMMELEEAGFIFYDYDNILNLDSIHSLDFTKYSEYFEEKELEERFPFDMMIIPGYEKQKLKKEFKEVSLEINGGEYGK